MAYKGHCISETELAIGLKCSTIDIYRDYDFREKSHMTSFVIDGHIIMHICLHL